MKLVTLHLKNFLSYTDEKIDLCGLNIAAIVGENGSGKSSLIEGILYALFGQTRAKSDDELSKGYDNLEKQWKVEEFSVGLDFDINNKCYSIYRKRTKGGTKLHFGYADHDSDLGGNTLKDTEAKIQDVIGMDYNSFVSSVILRQNEYDALLEMSPAECKRILMRIIGIEEFEKKANAIKKLYDEIDTEYTLLIAKVKDIKEEIAQSEQVDQTLKANDILQAEVKKKIKEVEEGLELLNKRYEKVKTQYEEQGENLERLKAIEKESNKNRSQLKEIENAFEEVLEEAGGNLEKILENKNTLVDLHAELQAKQPLSYKAMEVNNSHSYAISAEVKNKKEQIEKLDKKVCDDKQVCLLKREECDTKWREQIKEEISVLKVELKALEKREESAVEEQKKSVDRYNTVTDNLKKVRAAKEVVSKHLRMKEIKESEKKLENEKQSLEKFEIEDMVTDEDVKAMEIQIKKKKEQKTGFQDDLQTTQENAGKLKALQERRTSLIERLEELRDRRGLLSTKKSVYEILYKAFSKDGIPAIMIENVVPILEKDANKTLSRLSEGKISVEFRLEKKLKGGGFSDSFEIFVTDGEGTRSVRMFSGGERFRIIFAIHTAFSRYLTRRSRMEVKLLIIDEPAGLDSDGLEKLIEVLGVMKSHYEQIFVISHIRELIDSFGSVLYVEKDGTGSHVKQKESLENLDGEI